MEEVSEALAGDICAVFGVDCASGDTFVSQADLKLAMESIHVPEPVISMSIRPKENKDSDNFSKAVNRFCREDPTFHVKFDSDNKEMIASGMGELHLDIYAQRMAREYNCPVVLGKPKPLPPEQNTLVLFQDDTVGTNVPKTFGFRMMCEKGCLTGHKIAGVRFRLVDGDHHMVDSNDISFILAAQGAVKQVYEYGSWYLLEPVMTVEVSAPQEFQGSVLSSLGKRHGLIVSTDASDGWFTLVAEVPLNDMFGYSTELRSMTQGKGEFSMEYSRYSPALPEVQQQLLQEYQAEQEAAAAQAASGGKKKR
ncbi:hypothetical protein HPB48_026721 [Haemaphysalis longicornis]|uniref:Uncharacterized protein n=1 Tax=Haemaphysalis longicornis TaxID=44386 RepID=A0A9J6HA77_HAELO|nr:hypothetical protein HPB48_026721 [Haemaphysalis longicornis]